MVNEKIGEYKKIIKEKEKDKDKDKDRDKINYNDFIEHLIEFDSIYKNFKVSQIEISSDKKLYYTVDDSPNIYSKLIIYYII